MRRCRVPSHLPVALAVLLSLASVADLARAQPASVALPTCRVLPLPGQRTALLYGDHEVTTWHFDPADPRPFFFPLRSATGTLLTRMGHPGAPNHDHHRSIWFAHHKVNDIDFWGDQGAGRIRQKQWLAYEDGDEEALMAVLLGWFDGEGHELMEQEVVASLRRKTEAGIELELQLTFRATGEPVDLQQTNFGFLGVRMAKELSTHFGRGELRDSEGRRGEQAIFAQRARWVDYSGPTAAVPDGREGITCFDHPTNPRYPTHWHVREDGWMGASFCLAEGHLLGGERPLVLRYLLLAHSGQAGPPQFDATAERFAARTGFEVVKSPRPHRQFEVRRRPARSTPEPKP